jgi:predicted secreted hydrolase
VKKPIRLLAAVALVAVISWLTYLLRAEPEHAVPDTDLQSALSVGGAGYARAEQVRDFKFPADHGPHPAFRHEWWYFTGNLETETGRRFGYELTIFRVALSPKPPKSPSAWATNQLYTAHLAFTDEEGQRFDFYERFSRGALGLAGAQAQPFRVWLEDWSVAAGSGGGFPWRLQAAAGDIKLDLQLSPLKPLVLQGDRGLDQKSAAGHASYYYSYTRLATAGMLSLGAQTFKVRGWSWLDREWSSGTLASDQTGWDWFALQLDSGVDLMFYRLRRTDGSTDPYSGGVWVSPSGRARSLAHDEVVIAELDSWESPRGGRYPAQWRLELPARDCEFTVTPILADQELDVAVRYWEGAVDVTGRCAGRKIGGRGYVELTGYAEAL